MKLEPRINWSLSGSVSRDIDPALFLLLSAIQKQGSLQKSARSLGMSYRHAWGLVKKWENEFSSALVHFRRGRGQGTRLSEFGEKLLWADEYLEKQIRPELDNINEAVHDSLAGFLQPVKSKKINMFASHGLAIRHLHKLLEDEASLRINLQTLGSIDSLQNLHNGYCQVAGFHMPMELIHKETLPLFKRWLSPGQHLLQVSTREQGLIVKQGNPKKIHKLDDLSRRSVRFINRQYNSGTRIIVDELLKVAGIKSGQINGYRNEEFTHAAVAAMISSGAADVGFGIKAVTEQFKLDFVPVLREIYLLAIDEKLDSGTVKKITSILKSKEFRDTVNSLAGYNASDSGKAYELQWK